MRQKKIVILAAATIAVIGAGATLFNTAAETVMAAKAGQMERIPTSYQVSDFQVLYGSEASSSASERKEAAGTAVNYQVSMDSLNKGTPREMDLTMEEAAEAGGQYLRDIFGLDLEGAYVYMSYCPGTETFPRAFWSADISFEQERKIESTRWFFMVDAVTGELFNIGHGRHLDANPSLEFDPALLKDCSVYAELAGQLVEECGLLEGPVDKIEYGGQGYDGNDPTITVEVTGTKGETLLMTYSRYDQEFLGLITDTSNRITESALENLSNAESCDNITKIFGSE